ncbi:MAG: glycosyltransferase family 9 protein [Candidatus Pacearchaeota archaeon]
MKIIIISLAGIGDTLCATPLIAELRKNFPNAVIDVVVMWKGSKDILENNPNLNNVYHYNILKDLTKIIKYFKLRKNKYDISINSYPQSRIEYRLIASLIKAKKRLSHIYENWCFLDNHLINLKINEDYHSHLIENNLKFLNLLNKKQLLKNHSYQIFLNKKDIEFANKIIKLNNLRNKKIIGIHVGSGTTKNLALRRWPIKNYLELITLILKDKKNVVLLFGGPEELKDNEYIRKKINNERVINIKTSNIRESAAIIKHCDYFISIDTSLMHIAAAMKVKHQIVIETPTFNKTVEPYKRRYILIKNPLIHGKNLEYYKYDGKGIKMDKKEIKKVMNSIKVKEVFKKIV